MENAETMTVEVAYARADLQVVRTVRVAHEASVREAIRCSGLLGRFPEIDLAEYRVGVFGRLRDLDAPLAPGERVEIYRPLRIDPKEARRRRAAARTAHPRGV
jgi:putative ubiquitin-RnfH superfamily antitoxin RatB of RatAB toxin-antitoxin module